MTLVTLNHVYRSRVKVVADMYKVSSSVVCILSPRSNLAHTLVTVSKVIGCALTLSEVCR